MNIKMLRGGATGCDVQNRCFDGVSLPCDCVNLENGLKKASKNVLFITPL